jgi:hypothetical protein
LRMGQAEGATGFGFRLGHEPGILGAGLSEVNATRARCAVPRRSHPFHPGVTRAEYF